jgi:hypothetical protein
MRRFRKNPVTCWRAGEESFASRLTPEIQDNTSGTATHPVAVWDGKKEECQNEVRRAERSF